jgi:hypothetical protein
MATARTPNHKFIPWVGVALVFIGLAVMALGMWVVYDWRDLSGLLAEPLGLSIVVYGIDVIAHPRRRRTPRSRDLGDFILRLWSRIGPA